MKRRRQRKLSKRGVVAVLLGLAALLIVLPTGLTSRFSALLQALSPIQDVLTSAAGSLVHALPSFDGQGTSSAEYRDLQRRCLTLEHRVVSLNGQIHELRQLNEQLAGIRGRGLPLYGNLLAARVIGRDAVAWRDSQLLNRGTLRGVRFNDWVASRYFVDIGLESGAANGMAVLSGEILIGRIENAGTHTSRVALLTDPSTTFPVRIGRIAGEELEVLDADFMLFGKGHGKMEIRDVHFRYIETGAVLLGDMVFSAPGDPQLPVTMTVGRVAKIDRNPDNGLLYILQIEPELAEKDIREVFIVSMQPAE